MDARKLHIVRSLSALTVPAGIALPAAHRHCEAGVFCQVTHAPHCVRCNAGEQSIHRNIFPPINYQPHFAISL
jgi:hypothetical protein